MSEEQQNNTQQAEENSETNPTTQGAENKEQIPFHENPRFQKLIGQKNDWKDTATEYKQQLAEYKAKEKAEEEKALKEKGEFQTILDRKDAEIKEANTKLSEWVNYKSARRQSHMEELSEDSQEIYKALAFEKAEKFYKMEVAKSEVQNAGKANSSRAGANAAAKGEFGGYDSWEDLAANDLALAEKLLEKDTEGYIR